MSKRNDKLGQAAHIKQHTVGTSNEISFSVLDALKSELEGKKLKEDSGSSWLGALPLFSLPLRRKKTVATPTKESGLPLANGEFSVSDPSVTTPHAGIPAPTKAPRSLEQEVAFRKVRRRLYRVMATTLLVVAVLGLAGAGGWYLYQGHQQHMSKVSQLNEALDLIKQADTTVVVLDELMANPHDIEATTQANNVLADIPAALGQLQEAESIARGASADLGESQDKEAANQAAAAAGARIMLLESGQQIIEEAQRASEASRTVQQSWQKVTEADTLARDAAALVVDTTPENVETSKAKTSEAIEMLTTTQSALQNVAANYENIDLTVLLDYVAKRIEALRYALASDEALLARDKEEAATQNGAYNRADAEAAALAAQLPINMTQLVSDAYEKATAPVFETYVTARSQAGTADAFLRDYLGIRSK